MKKKIKKYEPGGPILGKPGTILNPKKTVRKDSEGNTIKVRESVNPITGTTRRVTKITNPEGDTTKTVLRSNKKGGAVKKKKK
jgi:hypothetical protein